MASNLRKAGHNELTSRYNKGLLADESVIEFLNTLLADEYTTFTKTLNYHWNLTGPQFHSLHEFLGDQYRSQLDTMDELAERVRILGSYPLSTVTEMVAERTLSERAEKDLSSQKMLATLYEDHLNIQMRIREFLNKEESLQKDPGTEDFLISVLKKHEMVGWKLKSHLQ